MEQNGRTGTDARGCAVVVREHGVIGTDMRILEAWEPITTRPSAYHTITCLDGGIYGRIGTCGPPADLEASGPGMAAGTDARAAAVDAWYESEYARAYAYIIAARPGTRTWARRDGRIEYTGAGAPVA